MTSASASDEALNNSNEVTNRTNSDFVTLRCPSDRILPMMSTSLATAAAAAAAATTAKATVACAAALRDVASRTC